MPTRVVFETAAFIDSVKKANIVAPTTGEAFDKAAGLMFNVDPTGQQGWSVLLMSTNIDIYRMEWLEPEIIEGDPTRWRLPSALFTKVISMLPIGTGKTVQLEEIQSGLQSYVRVTSGRTKTRFNLMDPTYYPAWQPYDPANLVPANDLGGRLAQVEWAAGKDLPPFSGVHFDGELAIATDRYRLACAPVNIPGLTEPITVPAGLLSQLLKQTGELKVGTSGGLFYIMPDDLTQLQCVTFGLPYPRTAGLRSQEGTHKIKIRKSHILSILERAASYGSTDRDTVMRCFIGEEEFAVVIANKEQGMLGDALEIPGQCGHYRFEIRFSPRNIIEAISNAPNEEIELGYTLDNAKTPVRVDGGSGYFAWVQPRSEPKTEGEI